MRRVLITGSGGFVGGVLAGEMKARGFDVWGADSSAPDGAFAGSHELVVDLSDKEATYRVLDEARPDWIVHLAAQSSVRRSFDEPLDTIVNNTLPALYLLEHTRKREDACRLLVIGSADEYGTVPSADMLPLREDTPVNPQNPYALAKSIQNRYCRSYAESYGLDVVLTRSFNHTGAGQSDVFVLPSFARQIAEIKLGRRDPKIRVGNLDAKRDFLDVHDVCDAYIALLEKGKKGETYNVCSGTSHRVSDLLDTLCELSAVDVSIETDPERMRPADTPELRGDNGKIRGDTGWTPKTPIEDTLRSLLEYWEKTLVSGRDIKTSG